ncbi:MAG: hypothetical protein WDA08_07840 [Weeksellaceae bacterium]
MENIQLNEILKLIRENFNNKKLSASQLSTIKDICNELISSGDTLHPETQPTDSSGHIPEVLAESFIEEFKSAFHSKYARTTRIFKPVVEKLFQGVNEVTIVLGQDGDDIIFCVEQNGKYFRIDETMELLLVDSGLIENYAKGLGAESNTYLTRKTGDSSLTNTRKFRINASLYRHFVNSGFDAILSFPAICMDDNPGPEGISYKYRLTYMMKFGGTKGSYELSSTLPFDRHGLCPPGNC